MKIPASSQALQEALNLSEEPLRQIELNELPLANLALKCGRLARIINDFEFHKLMEFETRGYPTSATGVASDVFKIALRAGRGFEQKDAKTKEVKEYIFLESIDTLEGQIKTNELTLSAAQDPNISISSSNPNQTVYNPLGNKFERDTLRKDIVRVRERLASRRSLIYSYVLKTHYEIKYSDIVGDVFSRIREKVDAKIGDNVPEAVQKFTAVYDNLKSDNPEDWSNAVHSCRRILQDLADKVFPPTTDLEKNINGQRKLIKMGADNFINRLIAFIESKTPSERFGEIVGSHLQYMGDRLDSVFKASQKGSHSIVTRDEADRYVVYTYLIVGDILSLSEVSNGAGDGNRTRTASLEG